MSNPSNNSEDSVSIPEMRLRTAMKIIELKKDIERCQLLEKAAAKSGNTARAKSLADVQQRAQLEIARLKLDAERYQKLERSKTNLNNDASPYEFFSFQSSAESSEKDNSPRNVAKKANKESDQTKTSKWSVKNAMSLLGSFNK